jgi:hypothetical protein
MDELDVAAKILDSKTAKRVYEDAVSPSARQVGAIGQDTLKALRLFTAPIQLAAAYQDRLELWLEEVRNRVPVERQVQASASIAGPVLLNLRFEDDSSIFKAMYLNLLTHAIDSQSNDMAHPAFVKVIDSMSPNEAAILIEIDRVRSLSAKSLYDEYGLWESLSREAKNQEFRANVAAFPLRLAVEHLKSLGVVECDIGFDLDDEEIGDGCFGIELKTTYFGEMLLEVCIDDTAEEMLNQNSKETQDKAP